MSLIGDQIHSTKTGAIYLPSIRKVRTAEIKTLEENFHWGEPDFKLYPSSLKSWHMCPKNFIRSRMTYDGINQLDGIARTRRGSAIHGELQDDFAMSEMVCPKPVIVDERMKLKLDCKWPEVPFHDFDTGFSGSADSVLLWRGALLPVEIKTTNAKDLKTWQTMVKKKFPGKYEAWMIQLSTYIYHFKKMNYWKDYPMNQGVIVVINSCMDAANPEGEYEEVIEYSQYEEKITLLIEHCALQRKAFIDRVALECTYPLCKEHKVK